MGMIATFTAVSSDTLTSLRSNPGASPGALFEQNDGHENLNSVDVDKAWQGIHYLLTGTAYEGDGPLAWVIMGGQPLDEHNTSEHVRFLDADSVKQIAAALTEVDVEKLRARYNPQTMEEKKIYPGVWLRDGDFGLKYILDYFAILKKFYIDTAARGDAVVTAIL